MQKEESAMHLVCLRKEQETETAAPGHRLGAGFPAGTALALGYRATLATRSSGQGGLLTTAGLL